MSDACVQKWAIASIVRTRRGRVIHTRVGGGEARGKGGLLWRWEPIIHSIRPFSGVLHVDGLDGEKATDLGRCAACRLQTAHGYRLQARG